MHPHPEVHHERTKITVHTAGRHPETAGHHMKEADHHHTRKKSKTPTNSKGTKNTAKAAEKEM